MRVVMGVRHIGHLVNVGEQTSHTCAAGATPNQHRHHHTNLVHTARTPLAPAPSPSTNKQTKTNKNKQKQTNLFVFETLRVLFQELLRLQLQRCAFDDHGSCILPAAAAVCGAAGVAGRPATGTGSDGAGHCAGRADAAGVGAFAGVT